MLANNFEICYPICGRKYSLKHSESMLDPTSVVKELTVCFGNAAVRRTPFSSVDIFACNRRQGFIAVMSRRSVLDGAVGRVYDTSLQGQASYIRLDRAGA